MKVTTARYYFLSYNKHSDQLCEKKFRIKITIKKNIIWTESFNTFSWVQEVLKNAFWDMFVYVFDQRK